MDAGGVSIGSCMDGGGVSVGSWMVVLVVVLVLGHAWMVVVVLVLGHGWWCWWWC